MTNYRCKHGWISPEKQCPDCAELIKLRNKISEWKTIDTAPKDGTLIITYSPNAHPDYRISINRFNGGFENSPSHWMPLPLFPEETCS